MIQEASSPASTAALEIDAGGHANELFTMPKLWVRLRRRPHLPLQEEGPFGGLSTCRLASGVPEQTQCIRQVPFADNVSAVTTVTIVLW